MTGAGDAEADRAARERLAREARATATTLLDWVGTRVDVAAAGAGPLGAARPRQRAGPCTWCPVCALVAAVRGEQPELTAHLAEQASALLVVLRLLVQAHDHDHPGHGSGAGGPTAEDPGPADAEVPWDAPHAHFDPEPAPQAPRRPAPEPDDAARPDRPTGKRGPRPSPRWSPGPPAPPPAAPTPAAPTPAARTPDAPTPAAEARTPAAEARPPVAPRSTRGVQRIPVRRRPRPC